MEGLLEFWRLAADLKREKRRGWVQRFNLSRVESVADHSYAVAMLSLYEGEKRGYDVGKLLKLALIHDLEEAVTGDLTPRDKRAKGLRSVRQTRRYAINRVLNKLPLEVKEDYTILWTDLKRGRRERLGW